MSPARSRAWLGFGITAAVLLAVVSWLTVVLVQLDRDELQARRQAALHERLRLALWRMDSWLSPLLAREAMRPVGEFRAFPAAQTAWTKGYTRLGPDEVLVKSPLLGSESAVFPLHFEVGPDGLTSPQVPTGNERDVCEANGIDNALLERAAGRLRELAGRLDRAQLEQRVVGAAAALPMMGCNPVAPEAPAQTKQSVQELSNRQRAFAQNLQPQLADGNSFDAQLRLMAAASQPFADVVQPVRRVDLAEEVGPMLPVWLETKDGALLLFARRVTLGGVTRVQGALVDWTQLQRELLALVADLFPPDSTRLVRCEQPHANEQPSMLASVPARFEANGADLLASGLPLPWMLSLTWGVTLLGLAVLGFTLRAAIGYGERRARFASAVTHELRTPLTTFRMYSEMLADGVVQDPTAQREYLQTLQRESDRLARVVENVLAWSRLEEGRFTSRRERHAVAALVDRIAPVLQRRLAEASLTLSVHVEGDAAVVHTDEDAVGQILFNLVDNAAKYARDASDRSVELRVARHGERMVFTLRDHGPGVPVAVQQRIFAPFDRGAVAASSNEVPGVGLGLALARGLARDLGGELSLAAGGGDGACFRLELPTA